jgi:hypothetical protein
MTEEWKRKVAKREKPKKEAPPDLYALAQLLRPDRKPVSGWIES